MTTFVFTAPDGKEYEVEGPEGATEQQAFSVLEQQLGGAAPADEDTGATQPSEDIRAEQERISESMSDPLGGLGGDENASEGAGVTLGEAITSAPFWAGVGQRFVQARRGTAQLFSTKEEAEQYAKLNADETAELQRYLGQNPAEEAAFNLGGGSATLAEAATAARYIPSPGKIGLGGAGIAQAAGRIGYGGAVAGALAATYPTEPGESKIEQFGKGFAFGALPAALVEGVAAAARPLASLFSTAKDAAKSEGLLKENPVFERGRALEKATGIKLSPGQVSGSPSLSEMRPPKGFSEKQAKQVLRNFVTLRDEIGTSPKLKSQAALAKQFGDATDDIYRQLVETRKRVGDFRYGQFRKSVDKVHAGKLMAKMNEIAADAVPGTDAGKIILLRDKLAAQLKQKPGGAGTPAGKILGPTGQPLTPATAPGGLSEGTLTPDQVLGWKERIDNLLAGKSDIFKDLSRANQRRLGGQLMDALHESLTETADNLALQGRVSPATLLKQAVADYKKFSAPINALEESALGAVFRTNKMTPEMAGRRLLSLEPTQVRAVYSILEQHRPDLIRQYQAMKLYNAMKSSVKLTPDTAGRLASQTKFDPKAALKELTKKDGLRTVFEADPVTMRRVNRGVALLDRVSDRLTVGSGGRQGLASREAELAGVAVSGHPVFLARTGAKILGPVGLWKLTNSEQGLATLRTLATAPLKSPKFVAAVESLLENLDDEASVAEDDLK